MRWCRPAILLAGLVVLSSRCGAAPPVLHGRVVDEDGIPLALVELHAIDRSVRVNTGRLWSRPIVDVVGRTDAKGRYVIELPCDPIAGSERFTTIPVDPAVERLTLGRQAGDENDPGRMTDIVVRSLDQTITGTVVDDRARPVAGAVVFWIDGPRQVARAGADGGSP